jgi:hypothetical protein
MFLNFCKGSNQFFHLNKKRGGKKCEVAKGYFLRQGPESDEVNEGLAKKATP